MLGLYLHIPFCQSICSYCNFNRGLLDADLKRRYVDALETEIRQGPGPGPQAAGMDSRSQAPRLKPQADTVFFGGGTPSLLEPDEIARLITACRETFALATDAEITLETNPETATAARFDGFRQAGVTRISFGVQSFDDEELKRLGRLHSAARAKDAVKTAKAAGFASVSFDLMFWLPGQSRDSWRATIEQAVALEPDHLSLYLLELYPNSPLKETMARAEPQVPSPKPRAWQQAPDDDAADMYLDALSLLDVAKYEQYEISNVARPGHFSRHNVKYWQGGSWRGFGCGAHSTVDGVRWKNVAATPEYIERVQHGQSVRVNEHVLSPQQRFEEALFTGLRLSAGVDRGNLAATFGVDPWARYGGELSPLLAEGYLWRDETRFGMTRRGMLVANEILATFV